MLSSEGRDSSPFLLFKGGRNDYFCISRESYAFILLLKGREFSSIFWRQLCTNPSCSRQKDEVSRSICVVYHYRKGEREGKTSSIPLNKGWMSSSFSFCRIAERADSSPFLSCSKKWETDPCSLSKESYAFVFCSKWTKSHRFSGDSYGRTLPVLDRGMRSLAPYVLCIIKGKGEREGETSSIPLNKGWMSSSSPSVELFRELCPHRKR